MFRNAFQKLEIEEATPILSEVNAAIEGSPFAGESISVLAQDLPFYAGYRFLEVSDHAAQPVRVQYIVYKPGDVVPLNWTNEPIYNLNEKAPIALSNDNVGLYAKFFFTYVRGRHGRFLIAESVDDIDWRDDPPPAARKAVGAMLTPVTITDVAVDGTYNLIAQMMFKDSLFKSAIHVKTDGTVSLSDEELLIEDMPVLDDTLGL
ncbi:MAG: hypothetical protein AAF569_01360 [Pseudomonadota bacterium]